MIDFTPEAKRKFDDYLERARRSVRREEAEEVEQNVIEHVELALAGASGPVGTERLAPVLEQLGPPERWLPEDERPMWRRVMDRVVSGPEEWRLPYLCFAILVLAIVFLEVGGALLLLPAYFVSRAYVELMTERGEPLGARRWLVLPPIALMMAFVCALALVGAAGPVSAIGLDNEALKAVGYRGEGRLERMRIEIGFVALATGAWWVVLSPIFAMVMRPFRALFLPLTEKLRRGHAFVLTIAGVVLAGIGATLLWVV